jgi:MFS family permease
VFGLAMPAPAITTGLSRQGATFADIRDNADVWAGWIVSVGGLTTQGVVFTFFPLLAHERGLTPAAIGLVFLVLGLANTLARFPAGWLVDRTGRCTPYAVGGVLVASVVTAFPPDKERSSHWRQSSARSAAWPVLPLESPWLARRRRPAGGSSWAATARPSIWASRSARSLSALSSLATGIRRGSPWGALRARWAR